MYVRGLQHTYADGTRVAFGETPLVVRPGERVVLIGPNGSGKSTLLLHVLGLLRPEQGDVLVFGQSAHTLPTEERVRIGALLQQVDEQIIGPTVWDDVAFTPRNLGLSAADTERLVTAALRRLGIWHLRHKVPHHLSAGERRKVALAGTLVFCGDPGFGPRLLVFDEPSVALDPRARAELYALVEALRQEHGTAVLLTTHLVETVPEFADTVYLLAPGGRIAVHGPPETVLASPDVFEALNIEPPVLSRLFAMLDAYGLSLPPPRSVAEAASLLAGHLRADGISRRSIAPNDGVAAPDTSA